MAAWGPVAWLTGQAVLFGAMAAILGVVANAMFLEAYGSAWLPVTYIVIGVAGVAISAGLRRGAERFDLLGLAVATLGSASGLFAISWLMAARPDGAWVSAPLLVLFPILIQLGFVFIGGQAGRVLDIAGIKTSFPRIMAGFPLGATLGGLAAVPLVDRLGRVEDLLLVTAVVQGGFAGLVWATGRRFARLLAVRTAPTPTLVAAADPEAERAGPSLRALLGRPFIGLLLAYQVLSALGSQVADFLVFDRAVVLFPGEEDLGRFLAGYTAVMNGIAIAFMFLLAGPLLRRQGLRLGIGANPVVDLGLAVTILAVLFVAGPASVAVLGIVSAARIADVALTDGMTRTSINALYQVLPARQRLAAQATVEGMGVPLAIGASGVLMLLLNELPFALMARIVVLALVCAAWAWVATRLYREYSPALGAALRRRRLLDPDAAIDATPGDLAQLSRLAAGDDRRAARLARDLVVALEGPGGPVDAIALGSRAAPLRDLPALEALLADPSPDVRRAALDDVRRGDDFAVEPALRGLRERRTAAAAADALGRLGDAAVPALRSALEGAEGRASRGTEARPDAHLLAARMVRAMRTPSPARDAALMAHVAIDDRSLGLHVIERLAASTAAPKAAHAVLDHVARDDIEHAQRVLGALISCEVDPAVDSDGVLRRALSDELDLVRRRVVAALVARHGRTRLLAALTRLRRDGEEAALAAEALEVTVGRDLAGQVVALLAPGLTPVARQRRLQKAEPPGSPGGPADPGAGGWLADLAADTERLWRSPWLRACAIRAIRVLGPAGASSGALVPLSTGTPEEPIVTEELELLRRAVAPG